MNNIFYFGRAELIKLKKMFVFPLILYSIIVGVISLSDIRRIGAIGGRTILIYLIITDIAVSIALMVIWLLKSRIGLNMADTTQVVHVFVNQTLEENFLNTILDNPFHAFVTEIYY